MGMNLAELVKFGVKWSNSVKKGDTTKHPSAECADGCLGDWRSFSLKIV